MSSWIICQFIKKKTSCFPNYSGGFGGHTLYLSLSARLGGFLGAGAGLAGNSVEYPGFALSLSVFGLNLFGGAARDLLDPKLRGTGSG